MKTFIRSTAFLAALLTPAFASAAFSFSFTFGNGATCPNAICGVAGTIIGVINGVLVPLIFAIAFIVFLYGIAKAYIFSGGDEAERSRGHQLVLWGIIGFAIMISLWGLVNVVAATFGLAGGAAPGAPGGLPLPQSM